MCFHYIKCRYSFPLYLALGFNTMTDCYFQELPNVMHCFLFHTEVRL